MYLTCRINQKVAINNSMHCHRTVIAALSFILFSVECARYVLAKMLKIMFSGHNIALCAELGGYTYGSVWIACV